MATQFTDGRFQALSAAGVPIVGGLLYTYLTSTTTPQATYTDATLATPNTNPLVLDSRGEGQIWLGTGLTYRLVLTDALGNNIWTVDGIQDLAAVSTAILTTFAGTTGSSLIGFQQTGTGTIPTTVQDILRARLSVKMFGAKGDGTTDDTAAIQAAINAAQVLVTNRFLGGVDVYFPHGTYLLSATLTVNTSNICLVGDGPSAAMLYCPNSTFDFVNFDGTGLALYSVGVKGMRFYSSGNATAGVHLKVQRVINSIFDNWQSVGAYAGLVSDGCAKTYYTNVIFSQENRTNGTTFSYSMDFKSTSFNNSDVHVSNFQVVFDPVNQPNSNSISIRGADGIYFSNGHQFGATLVQPTSVTCASIFWNQVYFDQSVANNVKFNGTSSAYRNFFFSNCYFRVSGGNGMEINASSAIDRIQISNSTFDGHRLFGIYGFSTFTNLIVDGCIFNNNNTDNAANTGDIYCKGTMNISNCRFLGGGAAGTAITLASVSSDCVVTGNSLASSTAGVKINNAAATNLIAGNTGYKTAASGTASVVNPATSLDVTHGLPFTPSLNDFRLAPTNATAAATTYYLSGATSTKFTINATPSAGTATWSWGFSGEHL